MQITNYQQALQEAIKDEKAGIKIAKLSGNADFSLYVTELEPNAQVNAHYHNQGVEIYQILTGNGEIHLGKPDINNKVLWQPAFNVKAGDVFTIEPGTVHQLKNPHNKNLILIFGCSESHLGSDRIII